MYDANRQRQRDEKTFAHAASASPKVGPSHPSIEQAGATFIATCLHCKFREMALETWRPAKDDISACTWPMVTNEAALETSCRGERHEALGNGFTPPLLCKK